MKTLLLDHANHYIHLPLSILFERVTNFNEVFPFITPNMISASHVIIALFGMKLLWSHHISVRQLGFILFEVRNFLDELDGTIARSRTHHSISYVDVGSTGFFVDGACDTIGSAALYIGAFVYLYNHSLTSAISPKSQLSSIIPLTQKPPVSKDSLEWSQSFQNIFSISNGSMQSKKKVIIVICCSAMQMILASLFWNQAMDGYHSILETDTSTPQERELQVEVLKSTTMWIIIMLWRVCNPHALLEMVLVSIFIDKLWSFLRWTQYYGFVIILILSAVTHAHMHYAKTLISSSGYSGNL
ncbi:hypothetical protein J437_LFUL006048 [Ladona fulva]|uniref:Ceramide phosphoethanolamine synthase n=1 Tax=Ladona fulva TaxID=123851 RepID=A0A8K0K063_LADFU|nr:hypothetical protein J437_LFUL006048 [Ladona fulva]